MRSTLAAARAAGHTLFEWKILTEHLLILFFFFWINLTTTNIGSHVRVWDTIKKESKSTCFPLFFFSLLSWNPRKMYLNDFYRYVWDLGMKKLSMAWKGQYYQRDHSKEKAIITQFRVNTPILRISIQKTKITTSN
jgi:hypothetical protein